LLGTIDEQQKILKLAGYDKHTSNKGVLRKLTVVKSPEAKARVIAILDY